MKKYNSRKEVPEKYKWDLTKIIKDDNDFKNKQDNIKNISDKIFSMKGTILSSSNNLKKYLTLSQEMNLDLEKLYVYSHLLYYSDTKDKEYKEKMLISEKLNEDIAKKLSFIDTEILSGDYNKIISMLKNEDMCEYEFYFEKLFRYKDMTLSEEEEKIITEAVNAFGTGDNVFNEIDNSDVYFGKVKVDGKNIELNHSNFIKLLNNKDQKIREKVFKQYYKYFIERKNTISECLKGQIKENFFISNIRKFNTPLEYSLYSDNIDKLLYTNLIEVCHEKNYLIYDYMELRKNLLNLDEMHMYDIYVDLVDKKNDNIEFNEGKKIIFEALKPLGKEYLNTLEKAFKEKWIDIYPNDGKRSGAYEWNTYKVDPYVSINYENNMESVNTLIHELGHAMHSYYSDSNNSYLYSSYPIFLAEIASTVNEVLLNEYLIDNAKDNNEKLLYITNFLDKVRTTIFRQTMFAEFEMIMHEKYKNNIPLTEPEFSETYMNLNKLYYGNNIISDDEIRLEWARIPHFYTSFYVYKYATGLASALVIANNILNNVDGAKENYIKFLSSGCSDYPLEILKKCGVDITDKKVLENAFNIFENRLNEAKKLIKKV